MEMFGNKSIRDISKIYANIFFGVDESFKFAGQVRLFIDTTFCPRFRVAIDWSRPTCKSLLIVLPSF